MRASLPPLAAAVAIIQAAAPPAEYHSDSAESLEEIPVALAKLGSSSSATTTEATTSFSGGASGFPLPSPRPRTKSRALSSRHHKSKFEVPSAHQPVVFVSQTSGEDPRGCRRQHLGPRPTLNASLGHKGTLRLELWPHFLFGHVIVEVMFQFRLSQWVNNQSISQPINHIYGWLTYLFRCKGTFCTWTLLWRHKLWFIIVILLYFTFFLKKNSHIHQHDKIHWINLRQINVPDTVLLSTSHAQLSSNQEGMHCVCFLAVCPTRFPWVIYLFI